MRLTAAEIPKRTLTALEKKHIYTTDDLVRWLPRKYRDYRKITPVTSCVPEQYYAIRGTLRLLDKRSGQRQYMLLKVEPETDDYTTAHRYVNVTFFSRMFLYQKYYSYIGSRIVICGKVSYDPQYGYSMTEPDELTLASAFEPGIRTIYPKVGGVSDDKLRESYDFVVSRAVAQLNTLSEYCLPFVRLSGSFVAFKGGSCEDEIHSANRAIQSLGGKLIKAHTFDLPMNGGSRTLVEIEKVQPTPDKYPRSNGKIKSKPL